MTITTAAPLPRCQVYFVSGGAAAWRAAELPWREPVKLPELPALSLPSLGAAPVSLDALAAAYKANPSAATAAGAALAAVATATFAIREFELLAQLAGLFAVGQFAVRNLLWADQREKTLASIRFARRGAGVDAWLGIVGLEVAAHGWDGFTVLKVDVVSSTVAV